MIFTFYSYKGGVGRSLAMAHVAYAFAERGLKVLAVDFDLEAPGLERYCYRGDDVQAAKSQPGLIDLILTYRRALTNSDEFKAKTFRDWRKFVRTVRAQVNSLGGRLDLLTAGGRGTPEQLRDYALTIRTFDWQDFFHNWKGDRFFEWLRGEWADAAIGYDVVLIDSRTGVTEMGGVCAYQLADAAVLLCAPNSQNLDGTLDVARDFTSSGVLGLRGGRPLQLLAVPTRLATEHPRRDVFLAEFEDRLEAFFPVPLRRDADLTYAKLALPYLPLFAVAEPVIGGPPAAADDAERAAFAALSVAVGRLASALTLLAEPGSALAAQRERALADFHGGHHEAAIPLQADTSRSSAGYDFYIDYGRSDAAAANDLAARLRAKGAEVFLDRTVPLVGAWGQEIERALDYSSCLLVCFGTSSSSPARQALLARARRSTRIGVVAVLLPHGSDVAPRSFGLEGDEFLDLRDGIEGEAIDRLITARRERIARTASPAPTESQPNPYRGEAPYGEDDARLLFGREQGIQAVVELLDRQHVVVLEGPAKVGKTSLVCAGVLPALRSRTDPAGAPRRILYCDASRTTEAWPHWSTPADPGAAAPVEPAGFELIVIDAIDSGLDDHRLVRAARRQQLDALLTEAGPGRRLLLVGRGIGLGGDAAHPPAPPLASFRLDRLSGEALLRAIAGPAKQAGHLLENGLAERLVEAAGPAHSAILQIQLTLAELWQARHDGWLTNRSLDAVDQLSGVFQRHVARRMEALAPEERAAGVVLFKTLCELSTSGTLLPRTVPWSHARTLPALAAVGAEHLRDALAASGLIDLWRSESELPGEAVQVALSRPDARCYFGDGSVVPDREFLEWRARFATLVLSWQRSGASKEKGLLLGTPLDEAARWLASRDAELTEPERGLIEASIEQRSGVAGIAFAVPGKRISSATPAPDQPRVRSVQVRDPAAADEPVRVSATPGLDTLAIVIADGPTLVLHPETARDLLAGQGDADGRRPVSDGDRREVAVPDRFVWSGDPARQPGAGPVAGGWKGSVSIASLSVVTALRRDASAQLVTALATKNLDARVEEGVYRLSADSLEPLKGSGRRMHELPRRTGGPLLVLIHGSFSDTAGTFGRLWAMHGKTVRGLFEHYADGVYALDHATLGASPIRNALTLARALPKGARLHLLTHSRGGLVAEVLARACAGEGSAKSALALFADARYSVQRSELQALAKEVQAKALRVERVVRVACPARGTLFASRRLDAYLSVLFWSMQLAAVPVAPQLLEFLQEVARRRADPSELPGLEAMLPGSPVIEWINRAAEPIPGELRVIAGDREGDSVGSWVKTLLSDAFSWTGNDLIVQTRSMYGGAPRVPHTGAAAATFLLDQGATVSHFAYFSNDRTVQAIARALTEPAPAGFAPIGALAAGEEVGSPGTELEFAL